MRTVSARILARCPTEVDDAAYPHAGLTDEQIAEATYDAALFNLFVRLADAFDIHPPPSSTPTASLGLSRSERRADLLLPLDDEVPEYVVRVGNGPGHAVPVGRGHFKGAR